MTARALACSQAVVRQSLWAGYKPHALWIRVYILTLRMAKQVTTLYTRVAGAFTVIFILNNEILRNFEVKVTGFFLTSKRNIYDKK